MEMLPAGAEYTCEACRGVFTTQWTDEEAEAEKTALFGSIPLEHCARVCDVCWRKMMGLPAEEVPAN